MFIFFLSALFNLNQFLIEVTNIQKEKKKIEVHLSFQITRMWSFPFFVYGFDTLNLSKGLILTLEG